MVTRLKELNRFNRGDLVVVISHAYETNFGRRGYTSYPRVYGFHSSVYVVPDTIGIVLEKRNDYCRVVFESCSVWMSCDKLKKI